MESKSEKYTDCFAYSCKDGKEECFALKDWYNENGTCTNCTFYKTDMTPVTLKCKAVAEARRRLRRYTKEIHVLSDLESHGKEKNMERISEIRNDISVTDMIIDAVENSTSKELLNYRIKNQKSWEECSEILGKSVEYIKRYLMINAVNDFAETANKVL